MAMGIVTEKDFNSEFKNSGLSRSKSDKPQATTPNAIVIDKPKPGRSEGDVNVPNSLRQVIGESSFSDGRPEAVALASSFGISPSSVSAYSQGAKSTASYEDRPNTSVIVGSKVRIQKRAISKLMQAMAEITPDKLKLSKAKDLSGIAKDMSAVVRAMEPETELVTDKSQQPQFLVYAPQFRDERSFDVIYAKE